MNYSYSTGNGKFIIKDNIIIIKKRPLIKKYVTTKNVSDIKRVECLKPNIPLKKDGFIRFFYDGSPELPKGYPNCKSSDLIFDISIVGIYYGAYECEKNLQEALEQLSTALSCKIVMLNDMSAKTQPISDAPTINITPKTSNTATITIKSETTNKQTAITEPEITIDVKRNIEIINDSTRIIDTTKSPEIFFSRYSLLTDEYKSIVDHLIKTGEFDLKLFSAFASSQNNKQHHIEKFITRCWNSTELEAEKLKTVSAKQRRYKKFFDELEQHKNEMSIENINLYTSYYIQKTYVEKFFDKDINSDTYRDIFNSLDKSKLILLKSLDDFEAFAALPNYYVYIHNLDVEQCTKMFLDADLITYAPVNIALNHCTVAELKDMLSEYGLPISGNKNILINRLVENIDNNALQSKLKRYTIVTELGARVLDAYFKKEDFDKRYSFNKFEQSKEERFVNRYIEAVKTVEKMKKTPIPYVYTIRSCGDEAVCKHCKKMYGKKFNIKDAVVGINYPPFKDCTCDFCRCYASHDLDIK